eukprot:gene40969-9212_t
MEADDDVVSVVEAASERGSSSEQVDEHWYCCSVPTRDNA